MAALTNPVNWILAAVLGYISYNYFTASPPPPPPTPRPKLPALVFKEYTPKELSEFDGRTNDTRILMAIQGKVFDVSRGRNFYGP
ncbi:Membrane-associated progesterone receptor component 1, partial [Mortierella sp. AD094]